MNLGKYIMGMIKCCCFFVRSLFLVISINMVASLSSDKWSFNLYIGISLEVVSSNRYTLLLNLLHPFASIVIFSCSLYICLYYDAQACNTLCPLNYSDTLFHITTFSAIFTTKQNSEIRFVQIFFSCNITAARKQAIKLNFLKGT